MNAYPASWQERSIAEVADFIRGVTYKKADARQSPAPNLTPLLRATNIGETLDVDRNLVYVPGRVVGKEQFLQAGDIVLASSSGSPSIVGKSARLPSSWNGTFGAFCAVIRARPEIDSRFLALYVASEPVRRRWSAAARGTNINNLKKADIEATPIPLPPLSEQQRIVGILEDHLSHLDTACRLLSTLQNRVTAYRRSILDSTIYASERKRVPLRSLVERIEAGRSFGAASNPAGPDDWGIIKVSAMTWGAFRPEENKAISPNLADSKYEIRPGDLLLSRANTSDYVGASVLVGEVRPRLLLSDKSLRIITKDVDRRWLHLALSSPKARAQMSTKATGTKDSMRNISQKALLEIMVPAIPQDQQQRDVALCSEMLGSVDHLYRAVDAGTRRSRGLRRSLLDAAFSGRLSSWPADKQLMREVLSV